jgi:phage portal protein BeeE
MGVKQFINKGVEALRFAAKSDGFTYRLTDHLISSLFLGRYGTTTPEWLQFRTTEDYVQAWNQCPPLVSVLIRKAQADINGKVAFYYRESGEPVKGDYNPAVKTVKRLFNKPNPMQTWRQFRIQQKIYQGLFGFCPVLMVKPAGFNNPLDTYQMWNLPPQYLEIHTTGKYIYAQKVDDIIDRIVFKYGGKSIDLAPIDVLLLNDSGISLHNQIVSDSRIRALVAPISNVVAANEANNVIIKKRGALGILANRDKDATGEKVAIPKGEKEALQKEFQRYGLSHEQAQVIITSANLEWQRMAMPVKELMLHETVQAGAQQICDQYGYPYELMGNTRGTSFANKKEAKQTLYQDTIIPEGCTDFEAYNEYFRFVDTTVEMRYEFSHVEALQVTEEEKAKAVKTNSEAFVIQFKNGVITLNRMRELLNQPTKAGDDKYYYETEAYQQQQVAQSQARQQNENN